MAKPELNAHDRRFLHQCIGHQLAKSEYATISIDGKPHKINYCVINNGDPASFIDVAILVTAGGAGWSLISPLGYELAKCGIQVIMVSQLGYGNSDNPPPLAGNDFQKEATALNLWADKVLPGRRKHWIFHSFAGSIGATLAFLNPKSVASLTLLNPIGFEKRNMLGILAKFALNGFLHGREYKDDPIWIELRKLLPKQTSSYAPGRILQRFKELRKMCRDESATYFKKMDPGIPYMLIAGEKDFVSPYRKSWIYRHMIETQRGIFKFLHGSYHNTTMFGSDQTAAVIAKFIRRRK